MSLDKVQARDWFNLLSIYFTSYSHQKCVEITKRVIDNKDDLINNNNSIAPGPSLNDKDKNMKNPQRLSSQLKVLLETADISSSSSGPKLN